MASDTEDDLSAATLAAITAVQDHPRDAALPDLISGIVPNLVTIGLAVVLLAALIVGGFRIAEYYQLGVR